jgi:hypothetical protein
VSRYVYAKTSISGKVVVIVVVEVPEICTNSPSKNSVVGDVVCPSGETQTVRAAIAEPELPAQAVDRPLPAQTPNRYLLLYPHVNDDVDDDLFLLSVLLSLIPSHVASL